MWTRSPESSKCGLEVHKAINVDAKSRKQCYAVGTRWLVLIAICRTIKNLLDNGIRYATVKALICRRLVPLLVRLPVCWGCPSLVMWDSSSGVERLCIPRGRKSEFAIVLVFIVPVILTSLLSCAGEPIGDRVGVDNLAISLGDPWSSQCAKAQGDYFVYLSFYSSFATVTRLGAVPLNLKGMSSPFATAAHKGFPVVPLFCPSFCLGRPEGFSTWRARFFYLSSLQGRLRGINGELVLLGWLALELLIVSPWRKGEDHERSTYKSGHNVVYRVLVAGLGELPPGCGWPASSSSLSNLSIIEPSVGEVDHAAPEYTPSAFRGGSVRSLCAGGLCRGAGRRPSEVSLTKTIRTSA
ncbi:hypothetical protein CRG98_009132 [Punica granatum]|uniref:Uncharacterized protein n=1 Tax=Punica granatum TaxID=22663 RepID=A0A2I0KPP2_PUNGR|nr:hypothetical protein CRG98_009132 [Punica granatum]